LKNIKFKKEQIVEKLKEKIDFIKIKEGPSLIILFKIYENLEKL
jgi:hypothetical protein